MSNDLCNFRMSREVTSNHPDTLLLQLDAHLYLSRRDIKPEKVMESEYEEMEIAKKVEP